jgi:nickel transport protein
MRKILLIVTAIIYLLSLGFIPLAFAHHAWVEKEGDRFVFGWGHSPKIDPYEPNRVKDIKAFDLEGRELALTRKDEKDKVYLSSNADVSMITLSFEGGYLVTTPEGKRRMTKREAQRQGIQAVDSFYSSQFAKSIFERSDNVTKPMGMKFEIVPLKNPLSLKQGEILPVKVLYEGKSLPCITIETGHHKEAGKTDKDGGVNIEISGQGMQVVIAKYRIVSSDPDADFLSFTTVLTWETK